MEVDQQHADPRLCRVTACHPGRVIAMQDKAQKSLSPVAPNELWQLGPAARPMTVLGCATAVVGLVGVDLLMGGESPLWFSLFSHAYLVAFTFYLLITLGALFFVMLHHLSRAGWSVTLRRLAEVLSANIGMMAWLFLGLLLLKMGPRWGQIQLGGPDTGMISAAAAGRIVCVEFAPYILRFAIYFAIWGFLAWYFRSRSVRQDANGDVGLSRTMERMSAFGMIAFALTITFAAIDLLVSLTPHWFSTIFGVYFFTDCVLGGLVAIALLAAWLQANGRIGAAITTEHYHDLGKLIFAFVFFWGYIAFSQYLLIWYANMPEETQFYMPRQIGPWVIVSIVLVVFHFVIPFAGLLSRHAKRQRLVLTFWAIWLLAAQLLDLFWLIMPNVYIQRIPEAVGAAPGTPLPEALRHLLASPQAVYQVAERHQEFMRIVAAPLQPRSLAIVLAMVLWMGGLYLVNTARLLRKAALVPVQDPRLAESLSFENT
jgi:hypothetical protein